MHNYDSYLGKSLYRLIKGALITNAQMGIETILALVNFLADLQQVCFKNISHCLTFKPEYFEFVIILKSKIQSKM